MAFKTSLCLLTVLCLLSKTVQADDVWGTNVDEAIAKSKEDGKTVAVLFTGSDWCPPCMKLEKAVFDTDEFKKKSVESYNLVKLDFPRGAETPKHNEEWSKKLAVTGFPSIIMLDMSGRPYAKTGFRDEGPEPYLAHMKELQKVLIARDEAFHKAESAKGDEKAKLLDQGLAALPEELVSEHYEDVIEQIVELDKKDKLGLRTKYWAAKDKEARKEILEKIAMAGRTLKPEKAIVVIDKALDEMTLPVMMKIHAQQHKLRLLRKLKDEKRATELLDEMIMQEGVEAKTQNELIVQKAYFLVSTNASDRALAMLEKQIGSRIENMELVIGKGELLDRLGKHEEAIEMFDTALASADNDSERVAEIISLKTEALLALEKRDDAITLLDEFATDEKHPSWLRADGLVQKSMLLREAERSDAADLAEKQALELIEDPEERSSMKKYIDQLKKVSQ